jgi:hypothetical protein
MNEQFSAEEVHGGSDILIGVGRVITSWQGVEYAICEIFLSFFPPHQRDVPSAAYHAIRTFEARATVVTALIKRYCSSEQIDTWADLWGRLKKRKTVRNAVAHGMVTLFGSTPNRRWGIGTSPYDLDKFKGTSTAGDYYTVNECEQASAGMIDLTQALDRFRASLEADATLQSKLLSQQSDALSNNRAGRVMARTHTKP